MQDNLDVTLKSRSVPEVSGDLAERIIAAAEPRVGKQPVYMIFQMVRPVYMMAAMVVLLVMVGAYLNSPIIEDTPDVAMDEIAMYMVYESLEIPSQSML